ncbi:MAG: hypothetical protein NTW49_10840 [Bacteroidia bacterium]|nr:hypothetical protein [Bacteroidia bacterium]
MKKYRYLILFVFILPVIIVSCEYEFVQPIKVTLPNSVSYATDIAPIFDANCTACHNGSYKFDLHTANSYNNLKNGGYITPPDATCQLYVNVSTGHSGVELSAADKALILKWLQDGALNN